MDTRSRLGAPLKRRGMIDNVWVRIFLQLSAVVIIGTAVGLALEHTSLNTSQGISIVIDLFSCLALAIVLGFGVYNLFREFRNRREQGDK